MNNHEAVVSRLTELPSLPVVMQKRQSLINKGTAGINEIASVIETDQAFTAKVLRLVNSPFYGFPRKIVSVDEAITMLGFNTLHQLMMTTSLLDSFDTPSHVMDKNNFWQHSFGVGIIARNLLFRKHKDTQNEAFMCGILHDIGRLVYIKMDPDLFSWFYFKRELVAGLEEEEKHFGIDHQALGEMVARRWNFPESISTTIAKHHTPLSSPEDFRLLVSAVNIADMLCHASRLGDSGRFYVSEFFPEAWHILELSPDDLEMVLRKALNAIHKSGKLLNKLS
jgi:putative nucleotidyltransferase with HDIG domain